MRDASPSPSAAANPQGSPRPANHRRKSCNSRSRFGRPCRPTCYARGSSFRRRIPRGCPTSPIHQGNGIHHDCGLSPEQHSARRKKAGNDCAGRPPAARTYPAPRRDLRFPKHKFSGRNLSNHRASGTPDYRCRDCSLEFVTGIRSWALPGLFAGLMELARIGGTPPENYLTMIYTFMDITSLIPVACSFLEFSRVRPRRSRCRRARQRHLGRADLL